MTKTIGTYLALIALFFLSLAPAALADRPQPRMKEALALLEAARDSDKPKPLLEMAKTKLERGRGNKGGRRLDALEAVNDALDLVAKGKDPKAKITHAITMVKAAIENGED
jgi:hypothetical protein